MAIAAIEEAQPQRNYCNGDPRHWHRADALGIGHPALEFTRHLGALGTGTGTRNLGYY